MSLNYYNIEIIILIYRDFLRSAKSLIEVGIGPD